MSQVALGTLKQSLFTAKTAGTGEPIDARGYPCVPLYVSASAAPGAGTLMLEEADWNDNSSPYAGTWSQIASINLVTVFSGGASMYAYRVTPAAFAWVRVRV